MHMADAAQVGVPAVRRSFRNVIIGILVATVLTGGILQYFEDLNQAPQSRQGGRPKDFFEIASKRSLLSPPGPDQAAGPSIGRCNGFY